MSDAILRCDAVSKVFRLRGGGWRARRQETRAVDGVDLELRRGEILALVGESGCGKSTLARLIAMLDVPTAGRVVLDGHDINEARGATRRAVRRRVQLVFQDPVDSLHPHMTALEAVMEAWRIQSDLVPRGDRRRRALELLERVGLAEGQAAQYPHQLSGGQAQRVAIARALALQPDVLVCDEPVASLDVSIRAQVLNLIKDLRTDLGLSCIFISHDLATVRYVADRIAVMYLGRIVETGDEAQVFANPGHPYTEALLSAVPVPEPRGRRDGRRIVLADEPDEADVRGACRFARRCWLAETRCRATEPDLSALAPGHEVACWVRARGASEPADIVAAAAAQAGGA